MKTYKTLILVGLLLGFNLTSCEKEDRLGFSIEFSDDVIIIEEDIAFYDSSTCILFLKDKISIPIVEKKGNRYDYPEFSVYVNEDNIYDGIIYNLASMVSPSPFYILDYQEPTEILPILFTGYPALINDLRNTQALISYLDSKSLLYHGISCTLDSVNVDSYSDSTVSCSITLKNNDNINYLIPDSEKMGAERFEIVAGGLSLTKKETSDYYQASTENYASDWRDLKMEDLSILERNSSLTFSYTFTLTSAIVEGIYQATYRFGPLFPYGTPFSYDGLNLNQEGGRLWIGGIESKLDDIVFD